MQIPIYQVDAFTSTVFSGNPAAVCPLDSWLPDQTLQHIARENNLSETAFFVGQENTYQLRWFTPMVEVELCGHATLASAWVILEYLRRDLDSVVFDSRSGPLTVTREGAGLTMDLPAKSTAPIANGAELGAALGQQPLEVHRASDDYLVLLADPAAVQALTPNFAALKQIQTRGVIVTAPGDGRKIDFVSRFFCPAVGIDEDPVTGSAHCTLTPFWAARLGKPILQARQISDRGGHLTCRHRGERVAITGQCAPYLQGFIELPPH